MPALTRRAAKVHKDLDAAEAGYALHVLLVLLHLRQKR